jgi:uncharacterized protein (UPF0276 family)
MSATFSAALASLPRLGVGLSGEYESAKKGIDPLWLKRAHPETIHFFEYGGDLEHGLDETVRAWVREGRPTTYHFLDVNLEDRSDVDDRWLTATRQLAEEINAAWICGDAGRWHFGRRERGHGLLLPPVLCRESALETAEAVARVQEVTGKVCLPENPPAQAYVGDLHILEYFALVAENADSGLLLDCAHLAIFQHLRGHAPLTGLDDFPLERVVEIHVAGGTEKSLDGFPYIDDSHSPEPVPATWEILEYVVPRAKNLKAIVFECEMNRPEHCLANFERLNRLFPVK